VGTFTPEGTWGAAEKRLSDLEALGVTAVELMPVAEFPGSFGWGYDGVNLFAPSHLYGRPEDFRRFVDTAHQAGLGVILDVVYNHLGPRGNTLLEFSPDYVSDRHTTAWGQAMNVDGPASGPVRELFAENAVSWVKEYHVDGLRFDAVHAIVDDPTQPLLGMIAARVREAASPRSVYLVAEDEFERPEIARLPDQGGWGLDGIWNDDFHHAARVALTGARESYRRDYRGTSQELVSATRWGFLFQGQRFGREGRSRGAPALDLPPHAFVNYLENHDQVSTSARALRLTHLAPGGAYRALTALLLLGPGTPLLFQGQEYGSSRPFLYFADHPGELGRAVREGRREFLAQWPSLSDPEMASRLADPGDPATFQASKLDPEEQLRGQDHLLLHQDLLGLRRSEAAFRSGFPGRPEGAVLGESAFLLRWFSMGDDDRLLLVNLGGDLKLVNPPEPLLGPVAHRPWTIRWSSEHPRYGGDGVAPLFEGTTLRIPGKAALLLGPGSPEEPASRPAA
jgi:maltooligosyltrehalose trehalohydrolase